MTGNEEMLVNATENTFVASLHTFGFIGATAHPVTKQKRRTASDQSLENYVGRITALFLPYLSQTISEHEFATLQKTLHALVAELKKQGGSA